MRSPGLTFYRDGSGGAGVYGNQATIGVGSTATALPTRTDGAITLRPAQILITATVAFSFKFGVGTDTVTAANGVSLPAGAYLVDVDDAAATHIIHISEDGAATGRLHISVTGWRREWPLPR